MANNMQPVDSEKIMTMLAGRKERMKMCLSACAGCTICAESCFLFMAKNKDPKYMPSYKFIKSLGLLYKKNGRVSREQLEEMKELLWRNCVLCGRCYCPMGIDIPKVLAFARSVLRSQGVYGVFPHTSGSPEAEHK